MDTTTLTIKGQITIPKRIRQALGLRPGDRLRFDVDQRGRVVLQKTGRRTGAAASPDRFARARGRATVRWHTDELMRLLRDD